MTEETFNQLSYLLARELRNVELGIADEKERDRRRKRIQKAVDEVILLRYRPAS